MDKNAIRATFDKHRANPQVSTEEHVRARQIELGEFAMARERIYLDKRYWIILRDCALGRNTDEFSSVVLAGLRDKVKRKRSICPISETVFLELFKQTDLETRRATASLIDELSEGLTLIPYPERVATEIARFLYSLAKFKTYPLHALVWSKLSYVLGVQHPLNSMFSEIEQRAIQKSFFDHMWQCSLTEIVDLLADAPPPFFDFDGLAAKLNKGSAQHADSIRSFDKAYKAEIRGSLGFFIHVAREVVEELASRQSGDPSYPSDEFRSRHEQDLLDFFCKEVRKKEVAADLRTLHIGALCHAAVRWDSRRKLTGNDLYDFHHAEAAVGYCDVFLTEQPLKTMLEQGHLRLRQDFDCRVVSSPIEAASWVTQ